MAIDPFPSKRNDPAWADFTESHDLTQVPRHAPAVPPGIDVQAMIKLVEQAQTVQSAILAPEREKLPWWAKHDVAKTTYWTLLVPTLVTGCANTAAHQWGSTGPAITGGLVSGRLTAVSGASDVLRGAVVSYSSEVKFDLLDVPEGPVVSGAAAGAMATGARRVLGADVGLALTGVAGPTEQDGKPVGTLCVGIDDGDAVGGDRRQGVLR